MADSIDRVFGHALNTVNKIRPGSQKPPSSDRLALYGLYKQSMEGDVADISSRPASTDGSTTPDNVKKEQEKWDAWKANESLSRTEAKRRYIEKLIETMHKYASNTTEAKELVEELEFVWDQVKNNSQHSSSERSSPLQHIERSGYLQQHNGSSGAGVSSSAAALEGVGKGAKDGELTVLSPMSQTEEDALMDEEREEFVDAPVSQADDGEIQDMSEVGHEDAGVQVANGPPAVSQGERRWRRKIESSLGKMTTEIAALREQLESTRFFKQQRRRSWFGWILRLTWWGVQLLVADAFLLWVVILYLRKKQDRRLEGAVRVLLGDAVAQVQKVTGRDLREVKMPTIPRISQIRGGKGT